jgi:pyrroloquinoline-quinone synthase
MTPTELEEILNNALDGSRLLDHEFYKRWECGHLSRAELTEYASQYRHFEAALPGILRSIIAKMPEGKAREFVEANLADEAGNPSHLELFDTFVEAVDADVDAAPSPAMIALLDSYAEVVNEGIATGLAGLTAYEMQAPGVASSKGEGLRKHYGLDSTGTKFWDVHAELDVEHSEWAIEALSEIAEEPASVASATRRVAQAWYSFLDEREALAPSLN